MKTDSGGRSRETWRDDSFLEKRLTELANTCYQRDIYTSSDFLNLYGQSIFHKISGKLPPVNFTLAGGNLYAERKIVIFKPLNTSISRPDLIKTLKITPRHPKFAEKLSHRDYLGAVLNLGIDRAKTGDIIIDNDTAYLYVIANVAGFIQENLRRVRHTEINCFEHSPDDVVIRPVFREITGTVQSVRLDAVAALAFGVSRSKMAKSIAEERAFINGRLTLSASDPLKEKDIVSIRGIGRFVFDGSLLVTKKGRTMVKLRMYE